MHAHNPTEPTEASTRPVNIEKLVTIKVAVRGTDGYLLTSEGMRALGKPELGMMVKEGYFLAAACRIMNDTARYIVMNDKNPKTGQRVQLAAWTVVQFRRVESAEGEQMMLVLEDGTNQDLFE